MDIEHYRELITGFCTASGLDDPARLVGGAPIEIDGIAFSLAYSPQTDPHLFFIYTDFGEVPEGVELETFYSLLVANLYYCNGSGPTMSISPETGHVLGASFFRIVDMTAEKLHGQLVYLAGQAHLWRQTHFLASVDQEDDVSAGLAGGQPPEGTRL